MVIRLPELRREAGAEESSRLDQAVELMEQRFRLDLPPGRYRITAWSERAQAATIG